MTSTVIPCLRYRDAPRMLEWLCEVVGFARHADLTLGAAPGSNQTRGPRSPG